MGVQRTFQDADTRKVNFETPPIVESALGIQFEELQSFKTIHFGLYFQEIRKEFPVAEEHPRLEPIFERFPKPRMVPSLRLQALPIPQRFVFKDKPDGSSLVQVQPDRFGFNWRKASDDTTYPRYDQNVTRCIEEFARFDAFCKLNELGQPKPSMCEVVYVNHIWPAPDESIIDLFYNVFPALNARSGDFQEAEEAVSFNRVYVINEERGRLYAEASIGNHRERGNFVLLKMTARTLHRNDDSVLDTLNLAHEWVVNGFVELTDETIRKQRWRQQE